MIKLCVVWLDSIYTFGIVVGILAVFLIGRTILRREETPKKLTLILIYMISLIALILGIIGIFMVWEADVLLYFNTTVSDIGVFFGESVGKIISSVLTIFISLFLMNLSKITLKRVGQKPGTMQKRKKTIAKVTNSIIKYTIGILMILIVLAVWGVNVAPAVAGLGILGLVIGLGAQKFINDLINGFFIIFEHHFDVGDKIEIQGFKGEVTDIGLKTTKLKNWKGDVKIIANGEISTLINYSKNPSVAIVDFGIAYHEDIQKTIDVLNQALPSMKSLSENILEEPQVLGVTELASSSVNLRVIIKTMNEEHYAIERLFRQKIKEILDENGIEIPFPQVVVHHPNE